MAPPNSQGRPAHRLARRHQHVADLDPEAMSEVGAGKPSAADPAGGFSKDDASIRCPPLPDPPLVFTRSGRLMSLGRPDLGALNVQALALHQHVEDAVRVPRLACAMRLRLSAIPPPVFSVAAVFGVGTADVVRLRAAPPINAEAVKDLGFAPLDRRLDLARDDVGFRSCHQRRPSILATRRSTTSACRNVRRPRGSRRRAIMSVVNWRSHEVRLSRTRPCSSVSRTSRR